MSKLASPYYPPRAKWYSPLFQLGNAVRRRAHLDRLGYLPEERGLYTKLTVTDVMTYFGALKGLSRAEARRRSSEWLERVELLTFVRSPGAENCGGETTVSPMLDAAHQAIAAASSGFVVVGPHLTASACAMFSGAPHMTTQGNMEIAEQLADHYKP